MSGEPPSYEECVRAYPATNIPGPTPGEDPQLHGAQGYGSPPPSSQLPNVSPNPGISIATADGNITAYPYSYPVSLTEKPGTNPEVTKTMPENLGSSYPAPIPAYPVQVPGYSGSTDMNYGTMPGPAPGPSPDGINTMQDESTTVIVTSQPQTMAETFQEFPVQMQCPHCHKEIQTQTEYVSGSTSWLWCIILAMFGCLLGCCLMPFCNPSCMDVEHICPECGEPVGTYFRSTAVSSGARSTSRRRVGLGHRMWLQWRRRRRQRHHHALHHNIHNHHNRQRQRRRRRRRQRRRRRRR